eukprot:TRINITY_DN113646_c0_g1_i1.p1 TRINITY_DN113646_c0_g1~~TRINITY_DN113646_c0_g1_i1.p1  ORF type:complete len:836 (-),score=192.98 TRINITY_DN113646_c0_g1_i1:122-2581(-)
MADEVSSSRRDSGLAAAAQGGALSPAARRGSNKTDAPRASVKQGDKAWKGTNTNEQKAHAEVVFEAAGKKPEARTEEEVEHIVNFVVDVPLFKWLSDEQQRGLCRNMVIENMEARQTVFRLGDPGDKFYVILNGAVGVQVTTACPNGIHGNADACTCVEQAYETAVVLGRGHSFGELALQSDQPRSATIVTTEFTTFLVVRRTDYERFAGDKHRTFVEKRVEFLKQCERISEALEVGAITMQDVSAIANCLSLVPGTADPADDPTDEAVSTIPQHIICQQGEPMDRILFVRRGALAMLRTVEVPAPGTALPTTTPTPTNMRNSVDRDLDQADLRRRKSSMGTPSGFGSSSRATPKIVKDMISLKRRERQQRLETLGLDKAKTNLKDVAKKILVESRAVETFKQALAAKRDRDTPTDLQSLAGGRNRMLLLRVGTVGSFQFFGGAQVSSGEPCPVSLVTDPLAEVYEIGKYDIMRKLHKRILSVLFYANERASKLEPTDLQLLKLWRQGQGWEAYCRGMHAQAIEKSPTVALPPPPGGRGEASESSVTKGIDAARNLEFLGHSVEDEAVRSSLRRPQQCRKELSARDCEYFSASNARFLRRLQAVQRDEGVRKAFERSSATRRELDSYGLLPESEPEEGECQDALSARFEQRWCAIGNEKIGLDLDKALEDTDFGAGLGPAQKNLAMAYATGRDTPPEWVSDYAAQMGSQRRSQAAGRTSYNRKSSKLQDAAPRPSGGAGEQPASTASLPKETSDLVLPALEQPQFSIRRSHGHGSASRAWVEQSSSYLNTRNQGCGKFAPGRKKAMLPPVFGQAPLTVR